MGERSHNESETGQGGQGRSREVDASLVGRAEELAQLRRRLTEHRLVTVTGPGGVGKTSLALAAVDHAVADRTTVTMCELAEIESPDAVRHAVASALQVRVRPGELLTSALPIAHDSGPRLLLLDNCEHVLDAAADVVEELLAAGPQLSVLATSREALEIAGEQVIALKPLAVPASAMDPDAATMPAIVLFARRALAVRADFRLDHRALPRVVRICQQLDGVPLALEIAAARLRSLDLVDLLKQIERRFPVLSASARRIPDRHRSMQAVVEWSYGLLSVDEQQLFLSLAVFPGGCDLTAAIAVGEAGGLSGVRIMGLLDGLVAKSLLTVVPSLRGTRYRMLETLRAFGLERLEKSGQVDVVRDRHASYYADLMIEMRARGLTAWTEEMLPVLLEFDNVRSAVTWSVDHDLHADRAFDLLSAMWYVSLQHRPGEIAALTDRALARWPDTAHPRWSEVAATAAQAMVTLEDFAAARALAEDAARAGSSSMGAAWAWYALVAISTQCESNTTVTLELLEQADAAARAARFEPLRCDLMGTRAIVLAQSGRRDEALAAARRSLAMTKEHPNVFEHAWAQHLIGLLLSTTEPEAAEEWLQAALVESEQTGYPYGTNSSLRGLGVVAAMQGNTSASAEYFSDALRGFIRAGHLSERWNTIAALLPLLISTGRHESAATLLIGADLANVIVQCVHAPQLDDVRAKLEQELRSPRIAARGEAMSPDQLLALAHHELDRLTAGRTDTPSAETSDGARTPSESPELQREGDLWSVSFSGRAVHLPDSKGIRDLAVLLARPGREVAALDLASTPAATTSGEKRRVTIARIEGWNPPGDLGDRLDVQARAAYAGRIRELQNDLDDADAAGDPELAARAQEELDFLTRELATAYGLHGPRRVGDPAERARSAVTARIRATIAKVSEVHPSLGRHLAASIRTGRFCVYEPDEEIMWRITL